MPKGPKYKRRTYDEAEAIALAAFRSLAPTHLTAEEIAELQAHGTRAGGSVGLGWEALLGHTPEDRMHYEIQIYRPSPKCPYIEKFFARILVTRDRASDAIHFLWRPPVPEYNGPYFE